METKNILNACVELCTVREISIQQLCTMIIGDECEVSTYRLQRRRNRKNYAW